MAVKTWEVRNMEDAVTEAAVQAARRAKQTTAAWLTDAINERIAREREAVEGEVIPPGQSPLQLPGRPPGHEPPPSSITALELMHSLEAYRQVMELRGKPISPKAKVLIGAERLLRSRLLLTAPAPPPRRRRDTAANRPGEPSRQADVAELPAASETRTENMPIAAD
jgi:hypothetical protein